MYIVTEALVLLDIQKRINMVCCIYKSVVNSKMQYIIVSLIAITADSIFIDSRLTYSSEIR